MLRLPPISGRALAHLSGLAELTSLEAEGVALAEGDLNALSHLPQLTRLDLIHARFGQRSARSLQSLSNLTELSLYEASTLKDGDEAWLSHLTRLRRLDVRGTALSEDAIARLTSALPDCDVSYGE